MGFAVKFDVMTYVREHQNATSLQVQYRNNLFSRLDIENFTRHWLEKLYEVVAYCDPVDGFANQFSRESSCQPSWKSESISGQNYG